jgi:hypothetical protein
MKCGMANEGIMLENFYHSFYYSPKMVFILLHESWKPKSLLLLDDENIVDILWWLLCLIWMNEWVSIQQYVFGWMFNFSWDYASHFFRPMKIEWKIASSSHQSSTSLESAPYRFEYIIYAFNFISHKFPSIWLNSRKISSIA